MRLVRDDQVVCVVIELFQQGVVAPQLVHARYQQRMIVQRALADGPVGLTRIKDVEPQTELQVQLVLPLIHQPTGHHDEASLHVTAQNQLLDIEAGHGRLASPGSLARRYRSGVRGSISPYTARIWCGSGSTALVATASIGS